MSAKNKDIDGEQEWARLHLRGGWDAQLHPGPATNYGRASGAGSSRPTTRLLSYLPRFSNFHALGFRFVFP